MRSRPIAALGLLCCAAFFVVAAPAAAKEARLPLGSIGGFAEPRGLAVEQSTGDVYAIVGCWELQRVMVSVTAGQFKLKFGLGSFFRPWRRLSLRYI